MGIEEQINNIEREVQEIKEFLIPKNDEKKMSREDWEKLMETSD